MPAIPQSEVLAKFFEEIGEKCGEILAKFFADFRPSISRENGRKKFHEKSSTFSTVHQVKFFHCWNSGGLGAQEDDEDQSFPHFAFFYVFLYTTILRLRLRVSTLPEQSVATFFVGEVAIPCCDCKSLAVGIGLSDLLLNRDWCIPGFGGENKSTISGIFSFFLQFWGFEADLKAPRQTPARAKLRLKRFPNFRDF